MPEEKSRVRSPGYPFINLEAAIERARTVYLHEKRSATTNDVLAEHWGYRPTSSGAKLTLASLKKFGLLEMVGSMKSGQVKLSDLALKIILDTREDSPERKDAVKAAALSPELHQELWGRWRTELPSDATIKTYLLLHKGFNDSTVEEFIKEYKETISFAGLADSDTIPEDGSESSSAGGVWPDVNNSRSIRSGVVSGSANFGAVPGSGWPISGHVSQSGGIYDPNRGAAIGSGFSSGSVPGVPTRRFPMTLPSLAIAMIEVPFPMNPKDFDWLISNLNGMRDALVATAEPKNALATAQPLLAMENVESGVKGG